MRAIHRTVAMLAALAFGCWTAAHGGPIPLDFDDGNGTSQVDQYAGTSGSGWDTPWALRKYSPDPTGTMTATVTSTNPLSTGGGNYLSATIDKARGMANRQYAATYGSVDASLPHAIQFKYRCDSLSGDWTSGRPVVIVDNTVYTSSTSGTNTWYAQVSGVNGTWSALGGTTNVPFQVGQTYDITVMVRPADNSYDLYVSNGASVNPPDAGSVLNASFRRKEGNVGRMLAFGDDSNDGSPGSVESKTVEYSIDAIKILPAAKVWNNVYTSGSWTHANSTHNWSGAAPPTATDDAVVDNGGEISVRAGGTREVNTLYLGATAGRYGGINWSRDSASDLHVYADLIVGEDGTGAVKLTGQHAEDRAITIDRHLYVGRRTGSVGTVAQDRGSVTVNDNLLMGYETGSAGTYTLSGGAVNIRNVAGTKTNSWVGVYGNGTIDHTAGTFSVTGNDLFLGYGSGSTGTYNLSGAASVVSLVDDFTAGHNGVGIVNHNGGTLTVNDTFVLGQRGTSTGQYVLTDGTFLARNANNPYAPVIGSSGTGLFDQQGGSATFRSAQGMSLILGQNESGDGTYQLSGGTLAVEVPMVVGGNGTGRFHVVGDAATIDILSYVQGAGGTLELDINGISPLNVDGLVSLSGGLDVEFVSVPGPGDDFPIVINAGNDEVEGVFDGLPEGHMFYLPGSNIPVQITYVGNVDGGAVGNDVVLHVTPEPATLTLLAFGALGLAARRRRTRA